MMESPVQVRGIIDILVNATVEANENIISDLPTVHMPYQGVTQSQFIKV